MTKKRQKHIDEALAKKGQIKNTKDLANFIALIEGNKSKARVGDIREIIKILVDMFEVSEIWDSSFELKK